jgi:hypothetical protein
MAAFSAWLSDAAAGVLALCATLFVVFNAAAVLLVARTRDRSVVNRWTARWLGINLALLSAGIGVPVLAKLVSVSVAAFSATGAWAPQTERTLDERAQRPPR